MQDEEWFNRMKTENLKNTKLVLKLGPDDGIEYFNKKKTKYSMVFIDGHGGSRWSCINNSFDKTNIIVTHDTETSGYNWNLVKNHPDFIWLDIKNYNPWTSVITSDKKLIELLKEVFIVNERPF